MSWNVGNQKMKRLVGALALALSLSVAASNGAIAYSTPPGETLATAASFEAWVAKVPTRAAEVRDFEAFLAR